MNIPYVMRKCTKCGKWFVASHYNFYKSKKSKWGLSSRCKECDKIKSKVFRDNNKDYIKDYNKNYRENNKGKKGYYNKKWYKENKEKAIECSMNWKKNNPEKIFNYEVKRRSKEENQGNGITKEQWLEMMKFFDFKCAYSDEYIGGDSDKRTIDHIIPITKNGEHEVWNCVPMYSNYNTSKYNKNMLEWYLKQPFFSIERLTKIYEWRIYAYEKWGKEMA